MNKDLFGNIVTEPVLSTAQRMTSRQAGATGRDFYTTDQSDIERFIKAVQRDGIELSDPIWEPAAGRGDISKTLIKYGYEVHSTDIIPYRDKDISIEGFDFFTGTHGIDCKTIFTNPPFNNQEAFLEHALSLGVNVVFFVRLSFLSSIRRRRIYEKYNPAYVYVYSGRARCYKGGNINKGSSIVDYCVIMWKPPYRNETSLRWIV